MNILRIVHIFFIDTATTEIYTLSLHDALPISISHPRPRSEPIVTKRMFGRVITSAMLICAGTLAEIGRAHV